MLVQTQIQYFRDFKALSWLCLLASFSLFHCVQTQSAQQYHSTKLTQLDQDYSNCQMQVTKQLTMFSCLTMSYIFKSADLIAGNEEKEVKKVQGQVIGMRESMESEKEGAITYMVGGQVFRAGVDTQGRITIDQMFYIDQNEIQKSVMIQDAVVADNFTCIKLDNDTFHLYLRPAQINGKAVRSRTGQLTLSQTPEQLYYHFDSSSTFGLQLYVTPNFSSRENPLYLYSIIPIYNSTGDLIDVTFRLQSNQTMNLQTFLISSMTMTKDLMVLGCSQCDTYGGRVEIYERSTMQKVASIKAKEAGNLMLGQDLLTNYRSNGEQADFIVSSNSGGLNNNRQHYANVIRVVKDQVNGTWGFELIEQVVNGLAKTPQGGMKFGIYEGENLIIKYDFYRQIHSSKVCSPLQSFNQTTNSCSQCQEYDTYSNDTQSSQCSNCEQLWIILHSSQQNSFHQILYNQVCKSFDPTTIKPIIKEESQQPLSSNVVEENNQLQQQPLSQATISPQKQYSSLLSVNSTSTNNENSSQQNELIVPIVIGVSLFIALAIIAILVSCFIYRRNLKKKQQQQAQVDRKDQYRVAEQDYESSKAKQLPPLQDGPFVMHGGASGSMTERDLKDTTTTLFTNRFDTSRPHAGPQQFEIINYNSARLQKEVDKEVRNIQSFFNDRTNECSPDYGDGMLNQKKINSSELKQMTFMKKDDEFMDSCGEIDEFNLKPVIVEQNQAADNKENIGVQ